ncbi:MAG: DEAD/DEAH box helicase [Chloroflexi bacterium]|nr:DEAD/DEAH box helicase [Chloroflexota bacterium]
MIQIAQQAGFEIVTRKGFAGRNARRLPVPARLHPTVRALLAANYPDGLYSHQAKALELLLDKQDVCLATATNSGKSLVFITAAADLVQRDSSACVLALYPARALIQDQMSKWQTILGPLGIGVGYIDGGVPTDRRLDSLRANRVVPMTPDVAHAWMMSNLAERTIQVFIEHVHLVVLDEAHVYEGAFGTNMAYLLRRFQAAAGRYRVICSTATLGDPDRFVRELTGREMCCVGLADDGSMSPPKTLLLARGIAGRSFDSTVKLLTSLARVGEGRFLAFADSRQMVERLVAAAGRSQRVDEDLGEVDTDCEAESAAAAQSDSVSPPAGRQVLPYRAGYEAEDRRSIQEALQRGTLAGVVSTSALELGLDIGDIDLLLLLTRPQSMKAFWQRLGRAGRRSPGVCLLIDEGRPSVELENLEGYVRRPLEPSWLYLENRYIQYANVLCAAYEVAELGRDKYDLASFASLPSSFRRFLENELNPTEAVPSDLYPMKQRAQSGPHFEFPLRTAAEKSFRVKGPFDQALGSISYAQALREAYPGAIYYYQARPYRVKRFSQVGAQIHCEAEKHWTTRPIAQAMVFPRFEGGVFKLLRSTTGFVAEVEMQVSERVLGFVERRGSSRQKYLYAAGSPYHQRQLCRLFQTTGVCWYFPNLPTTSADLAHRVLDTFCREFGIQERDLGVGLFDSRRSPLGDERCQGVCIFDATNGSLRLTERLAEGFAHVLNSALGPAQSDGEFDVLTGLERLIQCVGELQPAIASTGSLVGNEDTGDWTLVVAPGETAIYANVDGAVEIEVDGYRYTPRGLVYDIKPQPPLTGRVVPATRVVPISGETRMIRVNLMTGEEEPAA